MVRFRNVRPLRGRNGVSRSHVLRVIEIRGH
jgi:hypothetical protein